METCTKIILTESYPESKNNLKPEPILIYFLEIYSHSRYSTRSKYLDENPQVASKLPPISKCDKAAVCASRVWHISRLSGSCSDTMQ